MSRVGDAVARAVREDGPRVIAALASRFRDIDLAEDALQEAAGRALAVWVERGVPERPVAWLFTVAQRVAIDRVRGMAQERAHRERMASEPSVSPTQELGDERLALLFAICHPAIEPRNQVGLALRALCGLDVEAVARAFVDSPTAVGRRLSRTSRKIRDLDIRFEVPGPAEMEDRVSAVLASIYLLFNEGYSPTAGAGAVRPELCAEAIRLVDAVAELLPNEPEILGASALMRLHHARRAARVTGDGAIVLLPDQDRSQWDRAEIAQGLDALERAMMQRRPGPYQIQAAIAALHAQASSADQTDWVQITALYGALLGQQPSPIVELNAAVALAMSHGPEAGLAWVDRLIARQVLRDFHLLHAVRADLLVRLGRLAEARPELERAVAMARLPSEQRLLRARLSTLGTAPQRRRRARRSPRRTHLTEREWSRIAHLFPQPAPRRGRPRRPDRQMLEAVLWVLATGEPWRGLPSEFGPWQSAYHRFRTWELDGTLAAVMTRLATHPAAHPQRALAEGGDHEQRHTTAGV